MNKPSATFFLSPGRCGTQWISKNLSKNYSDKKLIVEHEPISTRYESGTYYRNYSDVRLILNNPKVKDNFDRIDSALKNGSSYIEVGWPCYGAIPLYIESFENVKIVSLIRNPIRYAASIIAHSFFQKEGKDMENRVLDPIHFNAINVEGYDWKAMSPYERGLWFWLELHSYGEELQKLYSHVPFLKVKSEELFDGTKIQELCDFLDLKFTKFDLSLFDVYHRGTKIKNSLQKKIFDHEDVVNLSKSLGYDLSVSPW